MTVAQAPTGRIEADPSERGSGTGHDLVRLCLDDGIGHLEMLRPAN